MADKAIVFRNLGLLDVAAGVVRNGVHVAVKDGIIASVGEKPTSTGDFDEIDLGGRTLMPGLIDLHVHILAPGRGRPTAYPDLMPSYMHYHSTVVLREFLMRGFTTVRDAGGADYGHKLALERGIVPGPRMFVSGRALSQTGGHGDKRPRGDFTEPCGCALMNSNTCQIADGVEGVRLAVRHELRHGADQIKVLAGGGIVSESDPIDHLQYSMDELTAIVDEAKRAHTYAFAHAYTGDAVERCLEAGMRTIEHGNLIDDRRAKMIADAGAYLVPTLVTYQVLAEKGKAMGLSPSQMEKVQIVLDAGARSLELAQRHGVKMGLGTDLVSDTTEAQPRELAIRGEILPVADVLRSATLIGAEIVRMTGKLGVVAEGAIADLLAVDGDPLQDLALLGDDGRHLAMIMKQGKLYKNRLAA
jgi:imidazolonepropionase-like amidohydrolase